MGTTPLTNYAADSSPVRDVHDHRIVNWLERQRAPMRMTHDDALTTDSQPDPREPVTAMAGTGSETYRLGWIVLS